MVMRTVSLEEHPDLIEKYLEKRTFSGEVDLIDKKSDYSVEEVAEILDLPVKQVTQIAEKGFITLNDNKVSGRTLIQYLKDSEA